jgi:hypothetical protein
MKIKEKFEVPIHAFFTGALDGVKWLGSRPGRFVFGEIFTNKILDRRLSW